ncbi:D-arabinono-1,4-lactone oxidase [Pseudolysinimonas yzui]|uniref:FAD-linked oxidoreductase n=1 Tax=Pseudolysinimonas yzui TaxID=2708254 RepID=A0A8J3GRK6_9MICO|nr:D-arabinono-1,4-lactone oxidase [Pseudolysinimonas yzui]GHF18642.1 FAD-linked oxidoreductase [Pseudolysinimonas yzui]
MTLLQPGARWRNWGRSAAASPAHVARPTSVDEVVAIVRSAAERGLPVKVVGAGHSFTDIAATQGVLVHLDGLQGVLAVDAERKRVRVAAGTRLWQLGPALREHGLALQNMGDIDRQSIAGATSTGTHGTGLRFGGLATQITAATLVTGRGEVLHVDEQHRPELLPAVRLGLGSLGILVEVELQCVESFLLRSVDHPAPFDEVLDSWHERAREADHFEFYWWPHTDLAMTQTKTRLPAETPHTPPRRLALWAERRLLENDALRAQQVVGHLIPPLVPALSRFATNVYGDGVRTGVSYEIYASPRHVRFRESEYAIPLEALPQALRDVRGLVERSGWRISFPVEVRAAAADENWMSTAYGRPSAYIAVHRYFRDNPTDYFRAFDALMRTYDGRPHWGKMHFREADDLRPAYPRFDDFLGVRDQLDPDRRFANRYLDRVLGP